MNFGQNDMFILVGSFMVVVFMSLVFPALGLTEDSANQNEVPELNISDNMITIVGERPEFPRTPTSGELTYQKDITLNQKQDTLHESDDGVYEVFIETFCNNDDPVNEECKVQLLVSDVNDHFDSDNHTVTESEFENETIMVLEADDNESETWEVEIRFAYVENWGTDNVEYRISWELIESPDSGGVESIPIIGGIYSTADQIASMLGWGITVFFWFCAWLVELVLNLISILIQVFLYIFGVVSYMTTNYNNMLNGTTGFASFVLFAPVLLLSVELFKLGLLFVKVLPTT